MRLKRGRYVGFGRTAARGMCVCANSPSGMAPPIRFSMPSTPCASCTPPPHCPAALPSTLHLPSSVPAKTPWYPAPFGIVTNLSLCFQSKKPFIARSLWDTWSWRLWRSAPSQMTVTEVIPAMTWPRGLQLPHSCVPSRTALAVLRNSIPHPPLALPISLLYHPSPPSHRFSGPTLGSRRYLCLYNV